MDMALQALKGKTVRNETDYRKYRKTKKLLSMHELKMRKTFQKEWQKERMVMVKKIEQDDRINQKFTCDYVEKERKDSGYIIKGEKDNGKCFAAWCENQYYCKRLEDFEHR